MTYKFYGPEDRDQPVFERTLLADVSAPDTNGAERKVLETFPEGDLFVGQTLVRRVPSHIHFLSSEDFADYHTGK